MVEVSLYKLGLSTYQKYSTYVFFITIKVYYVPMFMCWKLKKTVYVIRGLGPYKILCSVVFVKILNKKKIIII